MPILSGLGALGKRSERFGQKGVGFSRRRNQEVDTHKAHVSIGGDCDFMEVWYYGCLRIASLGAFREVNMKASVCIDSVFRARDIAESLGVVKNAGFEAFEFWSWGDRDLGAIRKGRADLGLEIATFGAERHSLVDAAERDRFLRGLEASIEVAQGLSCPSLICLTGDEMEGISRDRQHTSLVAGLQAAVPLLENARVTLLLEPLNTLVDHKGYYLYSSREAFETISEVDSPYVKILYDIYHHQIMEGNLIQTITENIHAIGHFHAAGNPGRHELNIGEINYTNVLRAICELDYDGYFGLEYFPSEDVGEGLSAMRELCGILG